MLFHLRTGVIPREAIGATPARNRGGEDAVQANRDAGPSTLLDLLGGTPAVDRIVGQLMARLLHDPLMSPALDGVDLALLKGYQSRFFAQAFGAARADRPLMPLTVHVSSEQLTRVLLHIHDTLNSLGLPPPFTEQLLLAMMARGFVGEEASRLIGEREEGRDQRAGGEVIAFRHGAGRSRGR